MNEYYGMSRAYGKALRLEIKDFRLNEKPIKVMLLSSAIAKRKRKEKDGTERLSFKQVALPLAPTCYELRAYDLFQFALSQKDKAFKRVKKLLAESQLKDLDYMLQLERGCLERSLRFHLTKGAVEYIVRKYLGELLPPKGKHNIKNPWRHWRLTHLRQLYDFDGFNLTAFAGWTFGSSM